MSRHRKPDDAADVEDQGVVVGPPTAPTVAPVKARRNPFAERFLPHWGFLGICAGYGVFSATAGVAAVPQELTLGVVATAATWFGYLIQQSQKPQDGTK